MIENISFLMLSVLTKSGFSGSDTIFENSSLTSNRSTAKERYQAAVT